MEQGAGLHPTMVLLCLFFILCFIYETGEAGHGGCKGGRGVREEEGATPEELRSVWRRRRSGGGGAEELRWRRRRRQHNNNFNDIFSNDVVERA